MWSEAEKEMQDKQWTYREFIQTFGQCETLADAILAVEQDAEKEGMVVCEVAINNKSLSEEEEERLKPSPFSDVENFSAKMSRPEDLVAGAKSSVTEYIERLKSASVLAAEKFRTEDLQTAHQMFGDVIEATRCTLELLSNIKKVENQTSEEESKAWDQAEYDFLKLTQEILDAYEKNDLFLVSDLLEYEIPEKLDLWLKG